MSTADTPPPLPPPEVRDSFLERVDVPSIELEPAAAVVQPDYGPLTEPIGDEAEPAPVEGEVANEDADTEAPVEGEVANEDADTEAPVEGEVASEEGDDDSEGNLEERDAEASADREQQLADKDAERPDEHHELHTEPAEEHQRNAEQIAEAETKQDAEQEVNVEPRAEGLDTPMDWRQELLQHGPRAENVAVIQQDAVHSAELSSYLDAVERLDVSTPRDSAVLYSGRGNQDAAHRFCKQNPGRMTLDDTPAGQWLIQQDLYNRDRSPLTMAQADAVWARLSQRFVEQASGTIVDFTRGAQSGRVFQRTELQAILDNHNIVNLVKGN